jgi:hypothetical protein
VDFIRSMGTVLDTSSVPLLARGLSSIAQQPQRQPGAGQAATYPQQQQVAAAATGGDGQQHQRRQRALPLGPARLAAVASMQQQRQMAGASWVSCGFAAIVLVGGRDRPSKRAHTA